EQILAIALEKARSKFDKANIYVIKLAQLSAQGQYYQAVATTIEALRMFGMNVPTLDQNEALQQATADEIALYQENMTSREIDDLGDLPLMQNEDMKVCSQIIAIALDSITIIGAPDILAFFTIKMLNMSIEYGLSTFTPFGYLCFAIVQSNDYRDYDSAYQFASLALQLNEEKLPNPSIQSKIYHLYACMSALREPLSTGIDYLNKGYRQGLEVGDFVSVGYVLTTLPRYIFPTSVEEGLKEAQSAVLSLKKINNVPMALLSEMITGFGKSLQGNTLAKAGLNYENFTEAKYCNTFQKSAPVFLAVYIRYKLQLLCIFNLYEQALPLVRDRTTWIEAFGGVDFSFRSDYYLYAGITCAALYGSAQESEKPEYMEILNECIVEHKLMSERGEIKINFYSPYLILKAEKAKIENSPMEAMHFYDDAIAAAGEQGYWSYKALASELATQLWLTQQTEKFAIIYLKEAHYAYSSWGASAKVTDLEEKYSKLFVTISAETDQTKTLTAQVESSEDTSQSSVLDFASVLKASQMLAAEIELSRLFERFMKIVLENAGAGRGVLLLEQKGQWVIEAEGTIEQDKVAVLQSIPVTQQTSVKFLVPPTLINYVAHTQKSRVLYDASREEPFTDDPYVVAHQVKSALCTPLLSKGQLIGLLYLENPLIKGAFTSDRLEVLNLLSAQIAISIENAKLYSEAQENERTLKQFLEAIPVGVSVLDANGKPYYINQVAQQILGKGVVKEATTKQFAKIYQVYLAGTNQLYPSENLPIVRALQRGERTSVDNIEIHQGSQIIPVENRGAPIFDDKGNIAYAIAAIADITERKQGEAERERFTNELQRFNKAYERFVPHEFLSLLDKQHITEVQLGDQVEKEMTILFADICGFTSLSEKMTPQDNFNFINAYLSRMEPIIDKYHGFIDKYMGDTIMALFPTSADDAVQAAIDMLKTLDDYNQTLGLMDRLPIKIGIGLNSGHLMLGTVGGQNRMDSTVISDAVNLASHVKNLAKIYGTSLLITMQTYQKLQNPAQCQIRVIDAVKVKGKSDVVTVYEVFEADPQAMITLKNKTMSDFDHGFMLFHSAKFGDAKPFFEKVLQINENDKVAQIYLKRCEYFQQVGVPDDAWEEIEVFGKELCSYIGVM
ncbi:MAG TPA: GAF domain-containing protein, partial [Thioploca sp.]|nr:GAF domain-containing protein [Thioploca sp.]